MKFKNNNKAEERNEAMKYGIFFSYWSDEWKGDYFYYAKKVKDLGFDALEISAGELLNMSKEDLERLKA
ncbi:MAG: hypothetical protein GX328_05640, partial [Clostridiaceae bacterium]|nr:hypothetical protein [Clostridiaceae bacterium]